MTNGQTTDGNPAVKKIARQIRSACKEMRENREIYNEVIPMIFIALAGVTVIVFFFSVPVGIAITVFSVAYGLLGIRQVETDEIGLLMLLGGPVRQVDSGFVFVPLFLCELKKASSNDIQLDFGAPLRDDEGCILDPDDYHAKNSSYVLTSPNFKVTFKADAETGKTDGLAHRITTDPHLVARYKIEPDPMNSWADYGLREVLRSSGFNPEYREKGGDYEPCGFMIFLRRAGSIDKVNKAIREVAEAEYQKLAGVITLAHAHENLRAINQLLTEEVERSIGESQERKLNTSETAEFKDQDLGKLWWGINLESCWVADLGIPRKVRESLEAAAAAVGNKQAEITASEGKRQALINQGAGRAEAEHALLIAKARGVTALAEAMGKDKGDLAFQLIQLENALKHGKTNLNFVGSDLGSLITTILGHQTGASK